MGEIILVNLRPPRRKRGHVTNAFPPMDQWPGPPVEYLRSLEASNALAFATYTRNRKAVEYYVEQRTGKFIEDETGLDICTVRRLFERCTRRKPGAPDIVGFWACLASEMTQRTAHRRDLVKRPFDPALAAQGKGLKGALSAFFEEHKAIKKHLDEFLRTRRLKGGAPEPRLHASLVVRAFHDLCRDESIAQGVWPFNTKRKGQNAILGYWKKWKARHPHLAVLNQYGEDAAQEQRVDMAVARDDGAPPVPPHAYSRVQLDEHLLHALALVCFPTRKGADVVVGTRRVWALLLRETKSGAILASGISYREKYDANDVLRLIRKSLIRQDRFKLTLPGLQYAADAAYPNELPSFAGNQWQVLEFDADASHMSIADQQLLRKVAGCEVVSERVGEPTARESIEGLNALVAKAIEQLPSGTGSNPFSPGRRDPEQAASKWGIYAHHLEQILDVWSRNFNAAVSPSLGVSPLDFLHQLLLKNQVFLSPVGELGPSKLYQLLPSFERNLTFSRGKKGGALGVNLFGARYSSGDLSSDPRLRATSILAVTVYVEDNAQYAFVVPHALKGVVFRVKVLNKALRSFPHPLEARRLTEAANLNRAFESRSVQPDTMLDTLEAYGELARAKDAGATAVVSQFAGFMSQVQTGAVSYVMTPQERDALDRFVDQQPDEQPVEEEGGSDVIAPAPLPPSPRQPRSAGRGKTPAVHVAGAPRLPVIPSGDPFGLGL